MAPSTASLLAAGAFVLLLYSFAVDTINLLRA